MEHHRAEKGGARLEKLGNNNATPLPAQRGPSVCKSTLQASGPQKSSNNLLIEDSCDSVSHRNLPGHPISVLEREVNMDLPLLLRHEPRKKRAAQNFGGKLNSNQIQETAALKKHDWGNRCGALPELIDGYFPEHHWEDVAFLCRQRVMKIPMAALEGPMCVSFHGSYPVSRRPTKRDQQEPGSLKTHPHRVAWLAAKGLTSLSTATATGREANERSWRRNEDEDADFMAFIDVLLDEKARRRRSVHQRGHLQ
ncbi:hypothetical protein EPH_0051550 [Eimeria praecox]|uniref:Uncharacterized protein n=1 Tax=Eimeria praecox TaxID=51316 RepID=U6GLM6_9EIME|nr:hypothetical protein EPH_0051550 [Eimeria praecox]